MFLFGSVATDDGTALPNDMLVERVCYNRVRQSVYASSRGDFSMELGSMADSFLDPGSDRTSQYGVANNPPGTGILRRELANCELQASASGFHPTIRSLVDFSTLGSSTTMGTIDVGAIVVHRVEKIEGTTLSASPYKAPKDARTAYEKGLEAEKNGKLANASKYFEKAVEIYPKYKDAWFQLGAVLQKENQVDAARTAYTHATAIDTGFLPPYLALASMAYDAENWAEVLSLTGHILDLDSPKHGDFTGYTLDLDRLNYADAYYYNSVANYRLDKFDEAERSALRAEHVDLLTISRFPQLHLLLADIFARKNNYAVAIAEVRTYLELVPHPKNEEQIRKQLADLQTLNSSVSSSEKPNQN
jgi:Tetratricopeptide repeat